LRDRARREVFDAHPAELPRLRRRADVLLSGVSAGDVVGLAGEGSAVEVYAPIARGDELVRDHGLLPGDGFVTIRWVSDDLWDLIGAGGRVAPRAAVLLDLLESDDPRARREAARALAAA
jgi:hypothetical protein